jgi:hypothetical protein
MYTLSPSKSIKGSNYGEFLKDKNVLKMSKNMNKRATENYILKFLTFSSVSSDSIVKGIIDDIINTAVKTAEVDEQKTKNLQHFTIRSLLTSMLRKANIWYPSDVYTFSFEKYKGK